MAWATVVTHFLGRRHVLHVVGHLPVHHLAVGRFDEAVLVDPRKRGETVDQTDVRPFGRLDRAHPAIVGRVHVAHFKSGPFTGQTARPKRRQTAFVGHLRQRVGLVHELRQLRRAKELAHRGGRRFGVDQVLRHHRVDLDRGHPLLDRPLHAQQTDAILVLHQLADRTHPTVAEVVDVVDLAATVAQINQRLDARQDVFAAQGPLRVRRVEVEAHVHLDPANGRKVVTLAVEEQAVEQVRGGLDRRRLARTHDPVDVHERAFAVHVLVRCHGVADVRTDVDVVDVEDRNGLDPGVHQVADSAADDLAFLVQLERQLVSGLDIDRAGFLVDDVLGNVFARDLAERHQKLGYLGFVDQFLDGARGDLVTGLGDHFTGGGIDEVVDRTGAPHPLGEELGLPAIALFVKVVVDGLEIGVHDRLLVQPEGIEQGGHRQLAATVDAHDRRRSLASNSKSSQEPR